MESRSDKQEGGEYLKRKKPPLVRRTPEAAEGATCHVMKCRPHCIQHYITLDGGAQV